MGTTVPEECTSSACEGSCDNGIWSIDGFCGNPEALTEPECDDLGAPWTPDDNDSKRCDCGLRDEMLHCNGLIGYLKFKEGIGGSE